MSENTVRRWRETQAFLLALAMAGRGSGQLIELASQNLISSVAVATSGADPQPLSGVWS